MYKTNLTKFNNIQNAILVASEQIKFQPTSHSIYKLRIESLLYLCG